MEMLPDSPTRPVGVLVAAREQVASLAETLWAAARPEDLLGVAVELERLRSLVAAVEAAVAVEVEATEAAKTAGWVSPGDWLTHTAGGRHGHGSRLLRTARPLCGERRATLLALQAGEISPGARRGHRGRDRPAPRSTCSAGRGRADAARPGRLPQRERAAQGQRPPPRGARPRRHRTRRGDSAGPARTLGAPGPFPHPRRGRHRRHPAPRPRHRRGRRASSRPPCTHSPHPCRERTRTAARPPATSATTARGPGTRWCRPASKPARPTGCSPSSTAPNHGSPSRSRWTSSVRGSVRRCWTPATSSPSPPSAGWRVMPRSSRPSSAPWVRSVDVGRTQRLVTAAIWKALVLRDQHCRFPGCRRLPLACDAHHLHHWADGGVTSLDNLVLLCRAHHTLIHATPWQVRLNPLDRRPEFRPPQWSRQARPPEGTSSTTRGTSSTTRTSSSTTRRQLDHPKNKLDHPSGSGRSARGNDTGAPPLGDAPLVEQDQIRPRRNANAPAPAPRIARPVSPRARLRPPSPFSPSMTKL